jgi:hypothetical protein
VPYSYRNGIQGFAGWKETTNIYGFETRGLPHPPDAPVIHKRASFLSGMHLLLSPVATTAGGVTECCMRYTVEREVDFVGKKVLIPSVKYCRKGESFTDGNGKKTRRQLFCKNSGSLCQLKMVFSIQ